ncbi:MAG: hypothetical protein AABX51_05425 [Nanoarchaeota archaeon]
MFKGNVLRGFVELAISTYQRDMHQLNNLDDWLSPNEKDEFMEMWAVHQTCDYLGKLTRAGKLHECAPVEPDEQASFFRRANYEQKAVSLDKYIETFAHDYAGMNSTPRSVMEAASRLREYLDVAVSLKYALRDHRLIQLLEPGIVIFFSYEELRQHPY